MKPDLAAKLAAKGIEEVPLPMDRHVIVARGPYATLIERRGERIGRAGSPGMLTEKGMAMLVWREGKPLFVARGLEREATEEQVAGLRAFAADVEEALK